MTVTLTFSTNVATAELQWLPRVHSSNPLQSLPVLPAILFWLPETVLDREKKAAKKKSSRMPLFIALFALTVGTLALSGCGGSSSSTLTGNATPAGQSAVTITAAGSGNVTQTLSVNITVQ